MPATNARKYPSFRLFVVLNTVIFVFVSVIAQHVLMELADALAYRTMDLPALLSHFARLVGFVMLPSIVVASVLIAFFIRPFDRIVRQIHGGGRPSERAYEQALRTLVAFPSLLIALNIVIFVVAYLFAAPERQLFTAHGIVLLLQNAACGIVCACVQVTVNNLILARPRALLNIHFLGKLREAGSSRRNMLIMISLSLYVMFMIIGVSQSINNASRLYASVYESVVKEHQSIDAATAAYKSAVGGILQLPAGSVRFPSSDAAAREMNVDLVYVGVTLFLLLLAIFIQLVASRAQREQHSTMTTKLRSIAGGKGDLTERLAITQFDEMGELADAVNRFMEKLHDLFGEFALAGERVMSSSTTLRGVLANTAATTEQMVASIAQISSNVASQTTVAKETETHLEATLKSLDAISAHVDTQASFVEQTSSAITQMAASIRAVSQATAKANSVAAELEKAAASGELAVSNAARSVRDLEQSSEQVNAIVGAISKIAAQTNLLAMNAAIEAAHAGEAGRGFAVVAEEVRNLAETSATSAKEIGAHIKKMSALMSTVVQLSEGAGQTLQEIGREMSNTMGLIGQIASATQEQDLGANEIVTSMTSLVTSTQEIRKTAEEQKRNNAAIRESIEKLVRIFNEIRAATEEQTKGNHDIVAGIGNLQEVANDNQQVVEHLHSLLRGFVLSAEDAPVLEAGGAR